MKKVKVISSKIDNLLRVVIKHIRGSIDIQESVQIGPSGFDSRPVKDTIAIYSKTTVDGQAVIIGYVNKHALADVGESRIYSTDENGQEKIAFHWKKNGTAELGGSADFLARFNELKAGFDQLKSDHNDLVSKYNSHQHVETGGTTATTATTATPSTASIDNAKINELKTS